MNSSIETATCRPNDLCQFVNQSLPPSNAPRRCWQWKWWKERLQGCDNAGGEGIGDGLEAVTTVETQFHITPAFPSPVATVSVGRNGILFD